MEKIFFIGQSGDELGAIRSYLSDVAKCGEFRSVREAMKADGLPDLILLAADDDPEHIRREVSFLRGNSYYAKVPRIIFLPAGVPAASADAARLEAETVLKLPVDRSEVIAKIAEFRRGPIAGATKY